MRQRARTEIAVITSAALAAMALGLGLHIENADAFDSGGVLSLPWSSGTAWDFNGPHTWTIPLTAPGIPWTLKEQIAGTIRC